MYDLLIVPIENLTTHHSQKSFKILSLSCRLFFNENKCLVTYQFSDNCRLSDRNILGERDQQNYHHHFLHHFHVCCRVHVFSLVKYLSLNLVLLL